MKKILLLVLWWRLVLFFIAALATSSIGFLFPYPNFDHLIELGRQIPLFWTWAGFDGSHYITIAEQGYIADYTQAFFPLYPMLIRFVSGLINTNALFGGLVVSNIALVIAIVLFWKLLLLDHKKSFAYQTIFLFLLFPNSFYLGSVYSESTFLALLFASFLSARRQQWFLAGVFGSLASATRPVGIFLFPGLIIEWWLQNRSQPRNISFSKFPISLLLVPLGLLLYMGYLHQHFNDALKFLHSQPAFGADRSDRIILLYQVFWRYTKMIFTVTPLSLLYFRVIKEFFWSTLFLFLGVISFKKSRLSYSIFAMLSYITPTLTGTFSSMGRYILVMFPAFIVFSEWLSRHRRIRAAWYGFSGLLLTVNLALYVTGRWVA